MLTKDLVKNISDRTGIPQIIVRKSVLDFSIDCQSLLAHKVTSGFKIPKIGYVAVLIPNTLQHMRKTIRVLEKNYEARNHLFHEGKKYTIIFTRLVDNFFACATLILENHTIKNENYNSGAGRVVEINKDIYNECMERMEVLLTKIPVELKRKEYSKIQKILMRRMRKQGVLQSPGSPVIKM